MSRTTVTWLLILFTLFGLGARLAGMVVLKSWEADKRNAMEHHSIAIFMRTGEGFSFSNLYGPGPEPTSVQSPTYPGLVYAAFTLFDTPTDPKHDLKDESYNRAYMALIGLNCLIAALGIPLLYWLTREMGGSPATALTAAGLLAIWPSQIYAALAAQAVAIIITSAIAMTLLFYKSVRSGKMSWWIAYSILAPAAALTEPALLLIAMFSGLLVLLWGGLKFRTRIGYALVLLGSAMLIILPWTIRNYYVHDKFVPIKSTMWVNVWKGANPNATGTDRTNITEEQLAKLKAAGTLDDATAKNIDNKRQYDLMPKSQVAKLSGKREIEQQEVFKEYATKWISENPERWRELWLIRIGKTLWIDWDNPKVYKLVYLAPRIMLVCLSAVGLVLAFWFRWRLIYPLAMVILCLTLYALTLTAARFSLPFEPFQLSLMALVFTTVVGVINSRKRSEA